MSGLLRHTPSTHKGMSRAIFSKEYQDLYDVLTVKPSVDISMYQNNLITYLKGGNSYSRDVWSKFVCFMPMFSGMPSEDDALIWWNDPSRSGTFSATEPTYLLGQGFYGNGTSSYIDSTFNPAVDGGTLYTLNSASHGWMFMNYRTTGEAVFYGGGNNGYAGLMISPKYTNNTFLTAINGAIKGSALSTPDTDALYSVVRSNDSQIVQYKDKEAFDARDSDSTSIISQSAYICCFNKNGVASDFGTDTIGLFYAGDELDQTDINVLNDGVGIFLRSINNSINETANITVGVDKDYTTLSEAVDMAVSGNTLTIDAGTYDEYLDLRYKKLHLVGSGTLNTILMPHPAVTLYASSRVETNSTFNNILFDKEDDQSNEVYTVDVKYAVPTFTSCQINRYGSTAALGKYPLKISENSRVTMNDCSIDAGQTTSAIRADLKIYDTSSLILDGSMLRAFVQLFDSATANIDIDYHWIGTNSIIEGEGTSDVVLNVNTEQIQYDYTTGLAIAPGSLIYGMVTMTEDGTCLISGNKLTGQVRGQKYTRLFEAYSEYGFVKLSCSGMVIIEDSSLVMDTDDDDSGYHITESSANCETWIINSYLEFSGFSGLYNTWGSAVGNPEIEGNKLYIRNSEIVDNINDNIPTPNYPNTISCSSHIDMEDSIVTNQNWDGAGVNNNLNVIKIEGEPLQIRLKNVVFNNAENGEPFIRIKNINPLDEDDYICEDNVTYNGTGDVLTVSVGDAEEIYAELKAACPL